ncbi:hypothetical protein [Nioella sp.]|uniref:hypothetical protein n=1 Tax=Nioella sp. TaxID=1912091 RepID=UPI003B5210A1
MKSLISSAFLVFGVAQAMAQNAPDALLTEAVRDCALWEEGVLHVGDRAVVEVDLTGDGTPETLLDTSYLECSATPLSPYCGSGGCSLYAFVGDETYEWQALGWRVIDWDGEPVLLIGRDGGWCGVSSAGYCFEALNWNGETFLTVMPPME